MKITVVLLLALFPFRLFAQHLSGIVVDSESGLPIIYANITAAGSIAVTNYSGRFSLPVVPAGDTIRVTSVGYKPYKIAYNKIKSDTLKIYLQPGSIMLRGVNVKARHDFRLDSLRLRKEFSSVFEYQGVTFDDLFIEKDPYVYTPDDFIHATNSTTTLVSFNLLAVASLFDNKTPTSKLQKTLLKDEGESYVDQRFSRQKITALTTLKGDSLQNFINLYRPTIAKAKKMTDYDIALYIEKSYKVFMKNYKPGANPFEEHKD
jgi:hypothetical protein